MTRPNGVLFDLIELANANEACCEFVKLGAVWSNKLDGTVIKICACNCTQIQRFDQKQTLNIVRESLSMRVTTRSIQYNQQGGIM